MRILYLDIDTLRPDHLGCYGYHRHTSPNIDALASGAAIFENVLRKRCAMPAQPYRPLDRPLRDSQWGG